MSRKKYNLAKKIPMIMDIYLEYLEKHKGTPDKYIWENIIYPNFFIGYRQFLVYKNFNYKQTIRKFEQMETESKHLFKVYVEDKFYQSFTEYENAENFAKSLLNTEKEVMIFSTRTGEKVILVNEKSKIKN